MFLSKPRMDLSKILHVLPSSLEMPHFDTSFKSQTKTFVNAQTSGQDTFIDATHSKFCSLTTTLRSPSLKGKWG